MDPWQKFGFILSWCVRTGVEKTKTEKRKTLADTEEGEAEDPEYFEDWKVKTPYKEMLSPMRKYSPHTSDIVIKVEVILASRGGDSTQKLYGLRVGLIQDI